MSTAETSSGAGLVTKDRSMERPTRTVILGGGLRPPSEPPPRTGLGRLGRRSNGGRSSDGALALHEGGVADGAVGCAARQRGVSAQRARDLALARARRPRRVAAGQHGRAPAVELV